MFPFIWLKSCIFFMQLYVELNGDEKQEENIPKDVHLQIRHLSASYFRAGDKSIKDYRQPLDHTGKSSLTALLQLTKKNVKKVQHVSILGLKVVFNSQITECLVIFHLNRLQNF